MLSLTLCWLTDDIYEEFQAERLSDAGSCSCAVPLKSQHSHAGRERVREGDKKTWGAGRA